MNSQDRFYVARKNLLVARGQFEAVFRRCYGVVFPNGVNVDWFFQ